MEILVEDLGEGEREEWAGCGHAIRKEERGRRFVSAAAVIKSELGGRKGGLSHLHEVVDGFKVSQVVVGDVHADAEVKPRVAPVDDFEVTELGGRERAGGNR